MREKYDINRKYYENSTTAPYFGFNFNKLDMKNVLKCHFFIKKRPNTTILCVF